MQYRVSTRSGDPRASAQGRLTSRAEYDQRKPPRKRWRQTIIHSKNVNSPLGQVAVASNLTELILEY